MYQEVAENIFLVKIPLPNSPLKFLNSYFIRSNHPDSKNMVIDGGFNHPDCKEAFEKAMDALDFAYENTNFVATHLHGDHFAMFSAMDKEITLFLGRLDLEYLEKKVEKNSAQEVDRSEEISATSALFGMPEEYAEVVMRAQFMQNRNWQTEHIRAIEAGDKFVVGQYSFEAILFKGHTPGHIALYENDKKILICGDHILGKISPNITYWESELDSLGNYLESLFFAKQLHVEKLLCGHRSNEFDMYQRIEEIFDHHTQRLGEVVDILTAESRKMTAFEVASKMTWKVAEDMWSKYSKEQHWFATGEALAHLEYLFKRDKIKKYIDGGTYYYTANETTIDTGGE